MSNPTGTAVLNPRLRRCRFLEAMGAGAAFHAGHRPVAGAAAPPSPLQPRPSPTAAIVAAGTFATWTARTLPAPDRS